MSKAIKHSTPDKTRANTWLEDYTDLFTFKRKPISYAFVERIAEELVTWAREDDEALKLSQFYLAKGVPHSTFKKLVNDHPALKIARDSAMQFIGNRREIGALKKKLDSGMISSQMAKYDKSWWTLEEKRAELRARTQNKDQGDVTYKVVVDSYKGEAEKTNNMPEDDNGI